MQVFMVIGREEHYWKPESNSARTEKKVTFCINMQENMAKDF